MACAPSSGASAMSPPSTVSAVVRRANDVIYFFVAVKGVPLPPLPPVTVPVIVLPFTVPA